MVNEPLIIALSFIMFVALVYKPVKEAILQFLDSKVQSAIKDIAEARRLRQEAEEYLHQAQQKMENAKRTAEDIVARAEDRARSVLENVGEEVRLITEKKTQEALQRVSQQERQMMEELKVEAIELAVGHVQEAILAYLDKDAQMALIEESVRKIKQVIH